MVLSEVFRVQNIKPDLVSVNKEELFTELTEFLAEREEMDDKAKDRVLVALWTREQMLGTVIAPHIALPHASLRGQKKTLGIFGISKQGIDYGSADGKPVHIVMMLIDDRYETKKHLKMLQQTAELIGSPNFYSKIMACTTQREVHAIITEIEEMQRV